MYSCGKLYIGKADGIPEKRIKEHKDACKKGAIEKSAVAEHACLVDETNVIDQAGRQTELFLKKLLHIHLMLEDQRFNQDTGTDHS